jgi:non-specific serine/threonine protein kinase
MTGKTLSRYQIVEKIGQGGMSVVYKAHDTRLGRFVALKFLREGVQDNPNAFAQLQEEARIVSSLNHPGICTIYDIEDSRLGPIIVMEFMEGQTLRQKMSEERLTLHETLLYGAQIADALGNVHANGIVHRDVSSANLFITRDGRVKLMDFGIATSASTSGTQPPPGILTGTVCYMSPEQAQLRKVDIRSDIFSLGVVLYEMMAGEPPFRGNSIRDTLRQIISAKPRALREIHPMIPMAVEKVVNKCLRKRPADRYQTGEELRRALVKVRVRCGLPVREGVTKCPRANAVDPWSMPTVALN